MLGHGHGTPYSHTTATAAWVSSAHTCSYTHTCSAHTCSTTYSTAMPAADPIKHAPYSHTPATAAWAHTHHGMSCHCIPCMYTSCHGLSQLPHDAMPHDSSARIKLPATGYRKGSQGGHRRSRNQYRRHTTLSHTQCRCTHTHTTITHPRWPSHTPSTMTHPVP